MASKKAASSSKKKSSSPKKQDATKTPAGSSKASQVEERRPAPTVGDLAGAEFNPARTPEGERVAQTGANPRASRAGVKTVIGGLDESDDRPGLAISTSDGGAVVLTVGSQDIALTQDDVTAVSKHLEAARLGI